MTVFTAMCLHVDSDSGDLAAETVVEVRLKCIYNEDSTVAATLSWQLIFGCPTATVTHCHAHLQ